MHEGPPCLHAYPQVKWNPPEEPGGEQEQLTYRLFMAPPPEGWLGPVDSQVGSSCKGGPTAADSVSCGPQYHSGDAMRQQRDFCSGSEGPPLTQRVGS
jgi:hypothetical protein